MLYRVWVKDEARDEITQLPGNMRQRVRQVVKDIGNEPRQHNSKALRAPEGFSLELRRLRLERWRIIYVVDDNAAEVGILAVRKRPPYNYDDLATLVAGLN